MGFYDRLLATQAAIYERVPNFVPEVGLILGSGAGIVADNISDRVEIPYEDIPEFPVSTTEGHAGSIILGKLSGVPVACLNGRVHMYEGISFDKFKVLIRTLKLLGCHTLIITNAVGSLREDMPVGEIVMISDHINFLGYNPLVGPNDEAFGPRFFSMENAYDEGLRRSFLESAEEMDIMLHEGIYSATMGPSFETPAEIRLFHSLGVDVVGMSVIPEVLVARHCGLKVAALSMVTNLAAGLSEEEFSHEDVLKVAEKCAAKLSPLIRTFIKRNFNHCDCKEESVKELKESDLRVAVRKILPLIDLTSLNLGDTEEDITRLCHKAVTDSGCIAAVCVYPKFVKLAKRLLAETPIKIAAVVNFPSGRENVYEVTADIERVIYDGVDEIDVVWPYEKYLAGDETSALELIQACRKRCDEQVTLKVILETGKFPDTVTVYKASRLAIDAGADFIKTSTGKTSIGATLEVAASILLAIKDSKKFIGFKAAGGIASVEQAEQYLKIAEYIMGEEWITPETFRFGASVLLDDVLANI